MKQKLLLLFMMSFVCMAGFSQATATQPPPMIECNTEVFDLTTQIPTILGAQDPEDFTVTFYLTPIDADNGTNPMNNPSFYVAPQNQQVWIYARVDSELDTSFAVTDFFVRWDMAWTPQMPNVTVCDSYVLPALQSGNYFTEPGGNGTQIFPGDVITTTMEVYIYDTSETGMCTSERSFFVTILPTPELLPIEDISSCGPVVLQALDPTYTYEINGVTLTMPATISSSSEITVTSPGMCSASTTFIVHIGSPPVPDNLPPYIICNNDGNAFGMFNLESLHDAISLGQPGIMVTFYETMTDAENGFSPISNPGSYVNIVPHAQTIYVRVAYQEGICYNVTDIQLAVNICTQNSISGTIRVDYDNNGCTVSDIVAPYTLVSCTHENVVSYAYTDQNGHYTFTNIQQGENLIALVNAGTNFTVLPASHTVNVSGTSDSYEMNDFCLSIANPATDAMVYLSPLGNARPGFAATYSLSVYNAGNTMLSGTVSVTFDDGKLDFVNANPAQASQTANTLTFNYSNLMPLQSQYYYLTFNVMIPPTVNGGDILDFTATVTTAQTDNTPDNNIVALAQTVVNSYDPNDITVLEGEFISEAQADGYLNYVVRFQNTGTADAINVRIVNNLDANLDWSTFLPVASSHSYQGERNGSEMTFRFNNINLPSTADDEPASHGFVAYKIKPVSDFGQDDIITNQAAIFFDFNAPILTNEVTTQLATLGIPGNSFSSLKIYPNPATDRITIVSNESSVLDVTVFDLQGKLVLSSQPEITDNSATIDVSALHSGLYFVKVVSGNQSMTKKLIVK